MGKYRGPGVKLHKGHYKVKKVEKTASVVGLGINTGYIVKTGLGKIIHVEKLTDVISLVTAPSNGNQTVPVPRPTMPVKIHPVGRKFKDA